MNRLSLPLHFLLACVINFLIEVVSRLSLFEAWDYMVGTPLVFLYNAFLIFATFSIVYLVRRRTFVRILLSVFWLFLGTCNGYLLTKRVTPFNAQDLKVLSDALELTNNYFNTATALQPASPLTSTARPLKWPRTPTFSCWATSP